MSEEEVREGRIRVEVQDPGGDGTISVEPLFSLVRRADTGEQIFMIHAAPEHPIWVGSSFADCIRHFAKSYESEGVMSYAEAVVQIMAGLNQEMSRQPEPSEMEIVEMEIVESVDEPVPSQPYIDVSGWTEEDWSLVDKNRGSLSREEFIQRVAIDLMGDAELQRSMIEESSKSSKPSKSEGE